MLIQAPEKGISGLLPDNMLDPRGAGRDSKNVLYDRGLIKTAHGFSKLDLTTTGINSGENILNIFQFDELDGYSHLMAMTNTLLYENDKNNSTWTSRTQSGFVFDANIDTPISYAVVSHTDGIALNGTGGNAYYHMMVSDGGNSNIQRWAGRFETATTDLLGGNDYYSAGPDTHRALQVASYMSRLLLISPYYYDSGTKTWTIQPQRVQYPMVGKLETWTGTGSGFVDLLDTGGFNVWSALLGGQLIVYQSNGIWTLRHVGGSAVFDPYPYIPDLGLIAPNMLCVKNNVHYFMASDYNIYAYHGGSVFQPIGDVIQPLLEEAISKSFEFRCWMSLDEREKRLWVYYVQDGYNFITKAFGMDLRTGAWMVRDFTDVFDGITHGLSAVRLVGALSYITGQTYNNALSTLAINSADVTDSGSIRDTTIRYGDVLNSCTTVPLTADWSTIAIDVGGQDFSKNGGNFKNDFTENDILVTHDCSDFSHVSHGHHYYACYDVSTNGFSVRTRGRAVDVDYGICDASTAADTSFDATADSYLWFLRDPTTTASGGTTYRQTVKEFLTGDTLHLGDTSGFVYAFEEDYTHYDDVTIVGEHVTPTYDLQQPDIYKRWPGVSVTFSGDTSLSVYYEIDDGGFVSCGNAEGTTNFKEHTFYINKTGKHIRFKFMGTYKIREYKILDPDVEDDR